MRFDLEKYRDELEYLVNIDSGSKCLEGVAKVADWFANRYQAMGWKTEDIAAEPGQYGKSVLARSSDSETFDLLILCHVDTVFPDGTAQKRPFSEAEGQFRGPGVADMKSGCLMALYALEQLESSGWFAGNIGVFLNGEHELSCPTTRGLIESLSRKSKLVVTTEPARANGACVRQRKGILRYVFDFYGRSAHSGVNPQDGVCAVTEMAKMILRLKSLEDLESGITVNPGLVQGGQSINSIPDHASCSVDIRVIELADGERIDREVRFFAEHPEHPDIRVDLKGGITRPPLVPTARGDEVIAALTEIGRRYELDLKWDFSGGGSDASFASAMGVPALCGLGPVGGGYHTEKEYLKTSDLQQRLCLFRDFLEAVANQSI